MKAQIDSEKDANKDKKISTDGLNTNLILQSIQKKGSIQDSELKILEEIFTDASNDPHWKFKSMIY